MTIEQWLRRIFYLPDDRRKTVDYIISHMHPCEEHCPFAPDNKKGLCYNNDDYFCQQWFFNEKSFLRKNHAFDSDYERLVAKLEARRQGCRDRINEFLDTEITKEMLTRLRERFDKMYN